MFCKYKINQIIPPPIEVGDFLIGVLKRKYDMITMLHKKTNHIWYYISYKTHVVDTRTF